LLVRQTDIETERQIDRQKDRKKDRKKDRRRDKETNVCSYDKILVNVGAYEIME
jgi:hypothetical protein